MTHFSSDFMIEIRNIIHNQNAQPISNNSEPVKSLKLWEDFTCKQILVLFAWGEESSKFP